MKAKQSNMKSMDITINFPINPYCYGIAMSNIRLSSRGNDLGRVRFLGPVKGRRLAFYLVDKTLNPRKYDGLLLL